MLNGESSDMQIVLCGTTTFHESDMSGYLLGDVGYAANLLR